MSRLSEAFNSAMDDLQTIDWTETDGTDVKNILKDAFANLKQYRFEIISKFHSESSLNKFQKMMITGMLSEV